jgi:tripartite-type tricarboxylate transporter receptor subunit TctC
VPGGNLDLSTRAIVQQMGDSLGQRILVENRPGTSSLVGTQYVAKAAPDGYTLLAMANTFATVPLFVAHPGYDPLTDFAGVSVHTLVAQLLVVNPSLPARTVKELVALAKAKPGDVTFASSGAGGIGYTAAVQFNSMAGVKMLHVPYKGESNAFNALIAGETAFMFSVALGVVPHVNAGRLRLLATCGEQRASAFPDKPTMVESGFPKVVSTGWGGLLAPAGTPPAVIRKVQQETARQLNAPDLKARLTALGTEPVGSTPAEFAAFIKSEADKWSRVTREAGIAGSQ